jgi:hypothetical protein
MALPQEDAVMKTKKRKSCAELIEIYKKKEGKRPCLTAMQKYDSVIFDDMKIYNVARRMQLLMNDFTKDIDAMYLYDHCINLQPKETVLDFTVALQKSKTTGKLSVWAAIIFNGHRQLRTALNFLLNDSKVLPGRIYASKLQKDITAYETYIQDNSMEFKSVKKSNLYCSYKVKVNFEEYAKKFLNQGLRFDDWFILESNADPILVMKKRKIFKAVNELRKKKFYSEHPEDADDKCLKPDLLVLDDDDAIQRFIDDNNVFEDEVLDVLDEKPIPVIIGNTEHCDDVTEEKEYCDLL